MKNKNIIFSIIFFLSVLIILVSCSSQKTEWQGTIEEVDGITVVKNPMEPMYGEEEIQLEEELVIGKGKEDEDNIYVSDTRASHIRVFDKNGNPVRTIGRKGEGPGELILPTGIQILSQEEIVIKARVFLHFFSLQGKFLRRFNNGEVEKMNFQIIHNKTNYAKKEGISCF